MSKLGISTGIVPNDGFGDSLIDGAVKINSNFDEIYSAIGDGTNITNTIGYASTAGIATDVIGGVASVSSLNVSGISTLGNTVVGGGTTELIVNGDARITGILTIGTSSITLDGSTNTINVGSGVTIDGDGGSIIINGTSLTGSSVTSITAGSGISIDQSTGNVTITATGGGGGGESYWAQTDVGIHTLSNVGIGTTNPTSKLTVQSTGSASAGEEAFHPFIIKEGTFERSLWMGYATNIGGIGEEGAYINAASTGFSRPIYLSSRNQSQTPFVGIGTDRPTGTSGQMLQVDGGAYVSGNLGIGSKSPTSALTVQGDANISGVVTATTFVGNFSGSITDATNLTGGYANASQLNVSGIATISAGRIQVDASSNIRLGNLPAGSGSGRNIAIGDQVLASLSGGSGRNIGIGELSYYDTTTGQYNIGIGERAGQNVTTGAYNVILGAYDGNSGNLDIRTSSNNVVIADGQGNIRQYIDSNGNVGIKTTVVTEALTVAGIVSATSFYGTLNAGQLTGSLPAIDGSALTGVVGSGSGVVIEDDATPVGTAGTINFGSNLSVSFASGIATVSGASSVSEATTAYGLSGTPDLNVGVVTSTSFNGSLIGNVTGNVTGNVSGSSATSGYATTAGIASAVSSTININTTGIITASSFSGSASGLTNIPSGQLTGSLPAIDGSALLNVTAVGTGVAVEDNQVSVGSATTIDFGTGLDVTFSAGIATITASGGSLQSRTIVTGVTTSITNNGIGNTDITGFKSYVLMKVGLSTAGWLRLYTDSTSRTNDASRSVGIDPAPGSGVIAEVVTTGISTTQIISPFVMGGNLDNPVDTTIYASITNLSGSTQAITANLTILQLEA